MLHFNSSCNKMKSHYNFKVSCKTNCKVTINICLDLHNFILILIQSPYHYVLYVYHDFRLSYIILSELHILCSSEHSLIFSFINGEFLFTQNIVQWNLDSFYSSFNIHDFKLQLLCFTDFSLVSVCPC